MNTPTNLSASQTRYFDAAMAFEGLLAAKRSARPRPVNWFRITTKIFAFTAGCLISLALGVYSDAAPAKPYVTHGQHAPLIVRHF